MASNRDDFIQYHKDLVSDIFKRKEKFHRKQARLPIQEKIRILIELQEISLTVKPKTGPDDKRMVWQLQ
jgi:hypothetical protein